MALRRQPVGEQSQPGAARPDRGGPQRAAERAGAFGQPDLVPAQHQHPGGLQPGGPTADHQHAAGPRVGARDRPLGGLVTAVRLTDTADDRVAVVTHPAGLVAQNARPHLVGRARACETHQVGFGDLRPGHLDHVGDAVGQGGLGLGHVHDAALQHHGDAPGGGPHPPAQLQVEHRWRVRGGPVGGGGERPAADHDEQVDVAGEGGDLRGRLLGCHPGPGRELVAGQPQREDALGPQRAAHRGDHLAGQAQPVAAVVVLTLVGQPGVELAQQRDGPGVDLHPVGAGRRGQPGRGGETLDHRVDLGLFHLRGQFAAGRVGHRRRRPQHRLGERARALPAGVAEPGEHQGAVFPAGVGHRRPAGGAVGGQRCPFVGPVVGGDRRRLGDDDPGTAGGPPGVVGYLPGAQRAPVAEVGLVRPEQHSGGRLPCPQ